MYLKVLRAIALLVLLMVRGDAVNGMGVPLASTTQNEMLLVEAINQISRDYEVYFTFDRRLVNDIKVVYEKKCDILVEAAISGVLAGTELEFKLYDTRFVILYQNSKVGIESLKKIINHLEKIVEVGEGEIERDKGAASRVLVSAPVALKSHPYQATELGVDVSGQVISEEGEALIGATVVVKGSSAGAATDLDGNYILTNVDENATLIFSYTGFQTQEIALGGRTNLSVTLLLSAEDLDQVVVVGYGTVKKADLTGSVSSLNEDDFLKGINTSAEGLMRGKSSGVQVIQSDSEPGGGMDIRIRGSGSISSGSSPLYVIDGLPIDNSNVVTGTGEMVADQRVFRSPLSTINPSDIASIEILKDASATAIYGSRGSNGVILITTKSGSKGQIKVSYKGYSGVQVPENKLDILTPIEYQRVLNALIDEGGGDEGEYVTEIVAGGTDWQSEVMQNGKIESHGLSIQGGNDETKFFLSLGHLDQEGIIKTSGIKRYSARMNLEYNDRKKFRAGINLSTSYTHDDFVSHGFGINEHAGVLYSAIYYDPSIQPYNEDGSINVSPYVTPENPMALLNGEESFADTYRTLGTIFGEYSILPELKVKLNVGGDVQTRRMDSFVSRLTQQGSSVGGIATVNSGTLSNYLAEGTLTYDREFNENHRMILLGGVSTQNFIRNRLYGNSQNFASEATKSFSLQSGDPLLQSISTNKVSNSLLSYIGRVNYNLFQKYLFTATMRIDGSSRFGKNNKFGYFPSFAFAWKLSEENFIQALDLFSSLKYRLSWGQTGNQEIGNLQSVQTFSPGRPSTLDNQLGTTFSPTRLGNSDLKWETTEQWNIGLDMGFLRDRIYVSMDYYEKTTKNMLLSLPISPSSGFSSILTNVGSIGNSGFEFLINSRNLVSDFKWNTNLNFTVLKNEVESLGDIPEINHVNAGWAYNVALIRPGEVLNSFYGYNVLGVWQEGDDFETTTDAVKPGDIKYEDVNNDGKVNEDDRVILGNSTPDFIWGMENSFSYKGFDLSVSIQGVHGVKMLNNLLVDTYFPVNFRRNRYAEPYLNRWTPENPSTQYPSFVNPGGQGNKAVNSYTVIDASYIKINNIQLGYNIPVSRLRFIDKANIYITAQNLLTITDYLAGYDPSTNANGDPSLKIDYNNYPSNRTFLFGVELSF